MPTQSSCKTQNRWPDVDITFTCAFPLPPPIPALDGSTFDSAGSRVAIVGSSGSGKSTIVNLLLRFWDCREGRITLGGHDLHDYRADDVRALLGVVPQSVYLFNATIADNLLLASTPPPANRRRCHNQSTIVESLPLVTPHGRMVCCSAAANASASPSRRVRRTTADFNPRRGSSQP
jgi:ABC-type ATPase involved in cell division